MIISLLTNVFELLEGYEVHNPIIQEWEHEQLGLEHRGGREGQEDPGAGGHPQEAEGAHGDFAGFCAPDPYIPHQISFFGFQRKMQLAEDDDQPNSLPESDEIPDL